MRAKIERYIEQWKARGYPEDIPDAVPHRLMRLCLAPSYQAIALAILNNDHALQSLGFSPPYSHWYNEIKRVEIQARTSQVKT